MKDFVTKLLNENLPAFYYYHNYEHTLYVADKVIEIGKEEGCTQAQIDLLYVAALWHDTGYIKTYTHHEEESCELARHHLPAFGCSAANINIICGLIMATKIPQSPKNKLEQVIADADLEYLGTSNAAVRANDLFIELQTINPLLTKQQWNKTQVLFLEHHQYFTRYCKENKEWVKREYLNKLRNSFHRIK
jgi:uncharacterized protein